MIHPTKEEIAELVAFHKFCKRVNATEEFRERAKNVLGTALRLEPMRAEIEKYSKAQELICRAAKVVGPVLARAEAAEAERDALLAQLANATKDDKYPTP